MDMKDKIEKIRKSLEEDMKTVSSSKDCQDLKVKYFGKKGQITALTSNMKELSIEQKKEIGQISNEIKIEVTTKISELEEVKRNFTLFNIGSN